MQSFPFDLFDGRLIQLAGGSLGQLIARLEPVCLQPPWPWGHFLYGRLLTERFGNLPGDLIECGVGKGGTSIFLGHLAKTAHRRVFALDSFAGLPAPDPALDNPYFRIGDYESRPERGPLLLRFEQLLMTEGLSEVVVPVPGFFDQTLPVLPVESLCFAHIDADLYGSVLSCLEALWPKVVEGGVVVIDDFFHHAQGPARAASAYFHRQGLRPLFHVSFPYSVVVIKGEPVPPQLRRSLDGNYYSLDCLRHDPLLSEAVQDSLNRMRAAGPSREATNAALLRELLRPDSEPRSSDLYDYFRALESYWDNMDADQPTQRLPLRI